MTARPGDASPPKDPVDRWDVLWTFLPPASVAFPAAIAQTNGFQPLALLLSAVTIAWYWWMVVRHEEWQWQPTPMGVYFVGLLGLATALTHLDEAFYITMMGTYFQAFMLLPGGWAYAGVALSACLTWFSSSWGELRLDDVPSLLVSLAVTVAIGGSMRAVYLQNERRREIIAELERTSRELAELAEENADLQSQLVTQAREAGVHAERQRMAREIHDTIAQGLIGVITHLEAAQQVGDDRPQQARERMAVAQSMARESLAEARRSVQALRPAALSGTAALTEALAKVVDDWSARSGVDAGLTVTGTPRPLHPEVEITLLRTAQEALANIGKHARADRAGMTLSYMEDVIALDVRDNGAGFDPSRQEARPPGADGGFGLTAMRQRVARLAGTLVIESAPGSGTGLSATVPAIPTAEPGRGAVASPAADPASGPSSPACPEPHPTAPPEAERGTMDPQEGGEDEEGRR